jgi:hypothetical protein
MRFVVGLLFCAIAACAGGADDSDLVSPDVTEETSIDDKADQQPIAFEVVTGFQLRASVGKTEEGRVIRSASAFKAAFGTAAPSSIDFDQEWLAVYSAGVRTTGGYGARVLAVRLSDTGKTVKVTSELTKPGEGCIVTQALTKPVVVVKFAAQAGAATSRFTKLVTTKNCTAACGTPLTDKLAAAVAGMTYMSESDYPLTPMTFAGQGAPTVAKLRALTNTPAAAVVEERAFSSVMSNLTTVWDPDDAYSVEYAGKWAALRDVLQLQLTNLTVIRIGEISIDVYIVGESACGDLVGVKTTSIET